MNNPITCFILDDEQAAINILTDYVTATPFLQLAGSAMSAGDAMSSILQQKPQLVFLDIHLDDAMGIDLIPVFYNNHCKVVLTTAYPNYAPKGFDYGVADYLLKPIAYARFLQAADRVREQLALAERQTLPAMPQDYVFVKGGQRGQLMKLVLSDVDYIESDGNYTFFHRGDKKQVLVMQMKEIEELLQPTGFVRIHNRYMVPVTGIEKLGKEEVILKNGIELPVGNVFRKGLFARLGIQQK